jgi:aspartate carbamoyltransferase catalytic subunit
MNKKATSLKKQPTNNHLLDLMDLSTQYIENIFETTTLMLSLLKKNKVAKKGYDPLSIALAFFEPSTRTKISFQQAATLLGHDNIVFDVHGSSLSKGESFLSTLHTLNSMMFDILVLRHPHSGAAHFATQILTCPVINAGDGTHAHPMQALTDIFTMRQTLGQILGLNVVIIGDILHSRVARSNMWGLTKLGATVTLCGPPSFMPNQHDLSLFFNKNTHPRSSIQIETSLNKAVEKADIIMPLRIQKERTSNVDQSFLSAYKKHYRITKKTLSLAHKNVYIMHPGPVNEGVELLGEIAYSDKSLIFDQVHNGVAIKMAVLEMLRSKQKERGTPHKQ